MTSKKNAIQQVVYSVRAHRVLWGVDKVYSDRGGWVTVSGSDAVLRRRKSYPGREEKRRHFRWRDGRGMGARKAIRLRNCQ